MPAWLLPAIATAVSAGVGYLSHRGQRDANRQNREMAREQMAFQERMSNTAVQRSVEDYRRAGLNPALAYDRSASSPGGATATIQDEMSPGIASATRAREHIQQIQIAKQAHQANMELAAGQKLLLGTQAARERANTELLASQKNNQDRINAFEFSMQPHDARLRSATALLQAYQVAGALNQSEEQQLINRIPPALRILGSNAKSVTDLITAAKRPGSTTKTIDTEFGKGFSKTRILQGVTP